MLTKILKRLFIILLRLALLGFLLLAGMILWRITIQTYYTRLIMPANTVSPAPAAVVFGAGLNRNGDLSDILRDRMDVAIDLYQQGHVHKLLLSGDNRVVEYDEPTAMLEYALAQGIPPTDVQPDFGGRRTYDTCYRAKHIFQLDTAILVTQDFHLPRALFICRQLGIDAVGVSADLQPYLGARWFAIRETGATLQATWDVIWQQPAPVMGDPIPLTDTPTP